MTRRPIIIYASELAACVGMNRYRPVEDVAKKVWSRTDAKSYNEALVRNEVTEKVPIQDVLQDLKVTEKIAQVIDNKDAVQMEKGLRSFLLDHVDELESKNVDVKDVTSFVFTERGKNCEQDSLDRVQSQSNMVIRERNDKFYKRSIEFERDGKVNKYTLGGKVDGITEDGVLVEVKNRQYKIFPTIPLYEKIQIHAYMFLTGIDKCRFVQSFQGTDVEHVEEFSVDFWDDVKRRCSDFVATMHELMGNVENQDSLLSLGTL